MPFILPARKLRPLLLRLRLGLRREVRFESVLLREGAPLLFTFVETLEGDFWAAASTPGCTWYPVLCVD